MKQSPTPLSEQYVATLERHLKQVPRASLLPALTLGGRAVALGLVTLDLARIHEQALATLDLSSTKGHQCPPALPKQEARRRPDGFKNSIASIRRLVADSARSVRRAGRRIGGS